MSREVILKRNKCPFSLIAVWATTLGTPRPCPGTKPRSVGHSKSVQFPLTHSFETDMTQPWYSRRTRNAISSRVIICLVLATLPLTINTFTLPCHIIHPPRVNQPKPCVVRATSSVVEDFSSDQLREKLEGVWETNVPSSLNAIIKEAQASLAAALQAGEKRLRIDIRTPGLDEQFEQTAAREKVGYCGRPTSSLAPSFSPRSQSWLRARPSHLSS